MNKTYHRKPIYQALFTIFIAGLFIIPGSASIFNEIQKNGTQTTERGSTIYVDDDNTA